MTTPEPPVQLASLDRTDSPRFGRKAAVLGEVMTRTSLNVPDGFCLPTSWFDDFVHDISADNRSGSTQWFENVANAIGKKKLPEYWTESIRSLLHELGPTKAVCVRSSSSVEDAPDRSFAGQFYSALGLTSLAQVTRATRECWRSLYSADVIDYASAAGINLAHASMGVLIQIFIPADKSGVLFTRDPITSAPEMTVEATWGLGVPLVSGEIKPDQFKLRSGQIVERTLGTKRKSLISSVDGIIAIDSNAEMQQRFTLDESELYKLADVGELLDRLLGVGQDVEFAFSHGELWILQARPLTTRGLTDPQHPRDEW